jgi:hypothetical protein
LFGVIVMRIQKIVIVSTLVVIAGCSRDPAITITNESPLTLSNVVVSGSGFSESVESIAAGKEHSLTVRPRGDSRVRIVFDAGTNQVDSGAQDTLRLVGGIRLPLSSAQT